MGDWIKENKFESGLLFAVLAVAVIVYVMAGKWKTSYQDAQENYGMQLGTAQRYAKSEPYPTDQNRRAFEAAVKDYRGSVEGLQKALGAFRPKAFKQIAPSEFTDNLNTAVGALAKTYTDAGIEFPADKWRLGFENYVDSPPRDDATAYLDYQLKASTWLFGALAQAKPAALLNVYRVELPIENGKPMTGKPPKPYFAMPMEVTFRAPESAVRKFLSAIAGNKEYYFVVKSLRIQNEKPDSPPRKDDVKFEDKPAADNPFGTTFDLVIPEDTPAPEGGIPAPAPEGGEPAPEGGEGVPEGGEGAPEGGEGGDDPIIPDGGFEIGGGGEGGDRVLGQVLGGEDLNVFLRLELLLFKGEVKLP